MIDLKTLTIRKAHEHLKKGDFSARELAENYLAEIEKKNPELNAYLEVFGDVLEQAGAADEKIKNGGGGVLLGIPFATKDNILIKGRRAGAASKILEGYVATYDATVIKKLKEAGAIFLGRANMDEFAMGSSTENSSYGVTKNPHDETRVAGGSSGGSAAAVAADLALAALGSDTGGSIRQPASFCGVVGLKPTYGAVSRYGLIAMASSLDQIGPLTKTVEDAAILFKTIAGKDQFDATSADARYGEELLNPKLEDIKKLTVGLPEEYFVSGIEPEVARAVEEAIAKLKSLGVQFKSISLPHTKYALSCYYIIMPAEVSSNLARFDGMRYSRVADLARPPAGGQGHERGQTRTLLELYRKQRSEGFGAEAKRRIILGTFVLSSGYYDAYYGKAQKVRALIKQDFLDAFKEVDVILTPVSPTRAFKLGEKTNDPLAMYLSDIFTISVNLAGLPAISIPTTSVFEQKRTELPVGFQLIGKHWREADILGLGMYYERI